MDPLYYGSSYIRKTLIAIRIFFAKKYLSTNPFHCNIIQHTDPDPDTPSHCSSTRASCISTEATTAIVLSAIGPGAIMLIERFNI